MSDVREIEAKFEADPETLDVLLALESFGVFRLVEKKAGDQDDLYYDTGDGRLRQAGASLRIRRKSAGAEMTFKGDRQSVGDGHAVSRLEDDADLSGQTIAHLNTASPLVLDDEPSPLRRGRELAAGHDLVATARLRTARTTLLFTSGEDERIELAVDRCIAVRVADGRETEFVEVEAELKGGTESALTGALQALMVKVPGLRPSTMTKLERALG